MVELYRQRNCAYEAQRSIVVNPAVANASMPRVATIIALAVANAMRPSATAIVGPADRVLAIGTA